MCVSLKFIHFDDFARWDGKIFFCCIDNCLVCNEYILVSLGSIGKYFHVFEIYPCNSDIIQLFQMLYPIVNCIRCLLILRSNQASNSQLSKFVFEEEEEETEDNLFQHDRLSWHFWRCEKKRTERDTCGEILLRSCPKKKKRKKERTDWNIKSEWKKKHYSKVRYIA